MARQYLIDKSALVRLSVADAVDEWLNHLERGLIAISFVTCLEVGYSARNAEDYAAIFTLAPVAAMPREYLTPAIEERALEVQQLLAQRGHHRAPSIPDLLIAATAEKTRRTLLHVDKDFELIAQITGQPIERLSFSNSAF